MNTETGTMYYSAVEIEQAKARNEPIVEVSEKVAQIVEAGQRTLNRRERRRLRRSGFQVPRIP